MSLLFQSWFCHRCRFELCGPCWEAFPVLTLMPPSVMPCIGPHCQTQLFPMAVFSAEELNEHICAMESIFNSLPPKCLGPPPDVEYLVPGSTRDNTPHSQEMCKYHVGTLTEQVFIKKWTNREPFVLTGVAEPLEPAVLFNLQQNGRKHCTMSFHDGETWHNKQSTLAAYFKSWDCQPSSNSPLQIRVRAQILFLNFLFTSI